MIIGNGKLSTNEETSIKTSKVNFEVFHDLQTFNKRA